jgi:hypothetical protein
MSASASIYDQHRDHTKRIGAYAILKDGHYVASVTLVRPVQGQGRLYAYVHWIGTTMVRAAAAGYGYDKASAAVAYAARAFLKGWDKSTPPEAHGDRAKMRHHTACCVFWEHCALDGGKRWTSALESAGFTVCCVAD